MLRRETTYMHHRTSGGKLIRDLGVPGDDLCSDATSDVFVPTVPYQIDEFDHNGRLIQTIEDGDVPLGCAVNPKSGNLAVTNEASGAGYVAVFLSGKGPPNGYYDPAIGTFGLCTYGSGGNFFVGGTGEFSCGASAGQQRVRELRPRP
ncbi:MAG TPA: hypothetical protein VMU38_09370 [Candidatus Binatia bacterium]|nr:hypothetical protein [Candidatus Binatia bacterium]